MTNDTNNGFRIAAGDTILLTCQLATPRERFRMWLRKPWRMPSRTLPPSMWVVTDPNSKKPAAA